MERHKNALKADRQSIKRAERNRDAKKACRTMVKQLRTELEAKNPSKEKLVPMLNQVQKQLMTASGKGILRSQTVSRTISRLSAQVHRAIG